jgi:trimeric autotransporter adhesin
VGNDTLTGGSGNDYLSGQEGNDTYIYQSGDSNDTIYEGNPTDGQTNVLQLTSINFADVTIVGDGQDLLINIPGGGQIRIQGQLNQGGERPGINTVQFAGGVTKTAQELATGITINNANSGTNFGNTLNGTANGEWLYGGIKSDLINAGDGDDYIMSDNNLLTGEFGLGQGNDTVNAGAGNDNINGYYYYYENNTGNDSLNGDAGNDTIFGWGGNDTLTGGTGNDTLIGGIGDDTYIFNAGDQGNTTVEYADEGTDTVESNVTYNLNNTNGNHIENVILTGASAIDSTGNALNNVLTGNDANNTLTGGDGNDTLIGNGGNDILSGGNGNDSLDGGTGNDAMTGGAGNDTYVVDAVGDTVVEIAGSTSGVDTVNTTLAAYTLGANLENLVLQGAGNSTGTGNSVANSITGNTGNNTLTGGAGNDSLYGGAGVDVVTIDRLQSQVTLTKQLDGSYTLQDNSATSLGTDLLVGMEQVRFSDGSVVALDPADFTPTPSDDILIGTENPDLIDGLAGNDSITGLGGNDTLVGGLGVDTLVGGLGDDTYRVDNTGDVVTEQASEGSDTVESTVGFALGTNVENLTLTGSAAVNGTGNNLANIIVGNTGSNTLNGLGGDDTITSGGGGDELYGGDGNDDLKGGNTGFDYLFGEAGNDTLRFGDDGVDYLYGGTGDDAYYVTNMSIGGHVLENNAEGSDTVIAEIDYYLDANVENLILTGSGNFYGQGNVQDNELTGNIGNNELDGQGGSDTLVVNGNRADYSWTLQSDGSYLFTGPGAGTDTLKNIEFIKFNDQTVPVASLPPVSTMPTSGNDSITGSAGNNTIDALAGNDTIDGLGGNDRLFGNTGNDLLNGDAGNDTLDGGDGDDTLNGSDGNDRLIGGVGVNSLNGGLGNDTYVVDGFSDTVTELADQGTDTVLASVTYALTDNVENLTLTGVDVINGFGNILNNRLIGNAADNTLIGLDGNDRLDGQLGDDDLQGGTGNDTYVVDSLGDTVTELAGEGTDTVQASITYTLADHVENLTLTGVDAIDGEGNALNNSLVGNAANNQLIGLDGNDRFNGKGGDDTFIGGLGNDTYVVDNTGDVITELAGDGIDTVQAAITFDLTGTELEHLTLTGTGNTNGTGNAYNNNVTGNSGNNTLTGGEGNDKLDGKAGADNLLGGAGDDTYVVDNAGDVVTESTGEGTKDLVQASVDYTLGTNVENLTVTGIANLNGTGNTADNALTGNAGNNTLTGLQGNDLLRGGLGNDTYVFSQGHGVDRVSDAGGANDLLRLTDISNTNVRFAYNGKDLRVSYAGSTATDVVTLQAQNRPENLVETIQSADGTQVDVNSIISLITTYASTNGVTVSSLNLDNAGLQNYLLSQLAWA